MINFDYQKIQLQTTNAYNHHKSKPLLKLGAESAQTLYNKALAGKSVHDLNPLPSLSHFFEVVLKVNSRSKIFKANQIACVEPVWVSNERISLIVSLLSEFEVIFYSDMCFKI